MHVGCFGNGAIWVSLFDPLLVVLLDRIYWGTLVHARLNHSARPMHTAAEADREERQRVGIAIGERIVDCAIERRGLYLPVLAHWLDHLFQAGLLDRARGESLLANMSVGEFETSINATQALLATLAGMCCAGLSLSSHLFLARSVMTH